MTPMPIDGAINDTPESSSFCARFKHTIPLIVLIFAASGNTMLFKINVEIGGGRTLFSTAAFWTTIEVTKLTACYIMLYRNGESLSFEFRTSLKYSVPALLWGITNNIAFYQYGLDPTAVVVLQNLKIPATAILLKLILGKKYSVTQWQAIIFLCVACIQSQYPCGPAAESKTDDDNGDTASANSAVFISLCAVASLVTINSFNAAYMEGLLKDEHVTFWQTNQFLYTYGAIINFGFVATAPMFTENAPGLLHFFSGFGPFAWLQVVVQAVMGLSISGVMKLYDSNMKNGMVACSLIVTYIVSIFMGYAELNGMFIMSSLVVIVSLFQYSQNGL